MFNITELTCRVCLHEQQILINVFDELEDLQTNLSYLLEKCGDIQVEENDMFPKYLCEECTRELLISAKFRDKCAKSKEIFEEVIRERKATATFNGTENVCDIIEYSADEINFIAEEPEEMEQTPLSAEDSVSEHLPSFQCEDGMEENPYVEPVMDTIIFPPQPISDATAGHEVECSAEYVTTLGETTEVEVTEADLDYIAVPNEDYEVHIDLSNSAFIKAMPLKAKKQKSFKCDICGAAFVQAINLQKHLQKTHAPAQCYTCAICNHWFSVEIELIKHAEYCKESESDDEHDDSEDKKKMQKSSISKEPVESHRRCVYCERDFQTPFALRMHLRTHTGERPFQCQYCDKSFKTQSTLNAHVKRHTGQADFVCSVCNKAFFERGNLDVHMRTHSGERPHSCTLCQKTFTRVFLLELHMRTHTGEKPFPCSFCDRSFRQRSDWRSHLSSHTGVKQYNCSFCTKGYIKRSSLVQHMRTHSALQINFDNDISQSVSDDLSQLEEHSEITHSFDDIIEENEEVIQSKEVT